SGPRDTSPRDAALPVLTEQQAQRLRSLVRQAFAELGVEATVFADHLRDAQGREFVPATGRSPAPRCRSHWSSRSDSVAATTGERRQISI
ncbi:MAG: hypothetical protein ACR2K2_16975, partial [Mycobacteriales bacterium]